MVYSTSVWVVVGGGSAAWPDDGTDQVLEYHVKFVG